MRRTRILGFCLVAVFAIGGLASSSAFGSVTPTWYACVKASPKNTGNYANKTCSEASEAGKGGYELVESVGKGKEFKGKSGSVTLHVKTYLGDKTVVCGSSKDNGTPELPNRERHVTVVFSKCAAIGQECSSTGKKGEIKLSGLEGELGYLKESPAEVGLKLESEAHPGPTGELVKFDCNPAKSATDLEITVTGGVIGVVGKDVNTINKESEVSYVPGPYIGEHEFDGSKYTPIVNLLGWDYEAEEIAKEIKEDEEGKIAKIERPIIKSLICGSFIESLLGTKCTPEAYSGLEADQVNKGEGLEIKA